MSSDLVRFGIAIERDLLDSFDTVIARRGYSNRSEAIRDAIRATMVEADVAAGARVTGTLTLVYDHHVRDLTEKLTEVQHDLGDAVVSALHVHLDHDHCLEVIVLRGAAGRLKSAADRLLAMRGVINGRLTLTSVPTATPRHSHHDEPHSHEGARRAQRGVRVATRSKR